MHSHPILPVITYTNDVLGMTQVLAANNGITTTHNLYGRDLISQQTGNGEPMRLLLPDGLGSVRQEMAGNTLQTTTTIDPYGNMLTQTGPSGTVYGFTGEQEDSATGLLYLRARYYNPSLQVFMGRDAYPGRSKIPSTQHGYSYVSNSPTNRTDPSGLCEYDHRDPYADYECWELAVDLAEMSHDPIASYRCLGEMLVYNGMYTNIDFSCDAGKLLGSNAPYLIYKGNVSYVDGVYDGSKGTLTFYNGPNGTENFDAVSGGHFGGDNVPYITSQGFGLGSYPAGKICYDWLCYTYLEGTFPVDMPSLPTGSLFRNNFSNWDTLVADPVRRFLGKGEGWNKEVWGRYRIPLDYQNNSRSHNTGLFIHGGRSQDFPTLGCIRISNENIETLATNLFHHQEYRLFAITEPLSEGIEWTYYR